MSEVLMVTYDSAADTREHIASVNRNLAIFTKELIDRGCHHDDTKLYGDEKALFDEYTPKLKGVTYGSPEYNAFLTELRVGLEHHYANNRHHPEHFKNGLSDMSLIDLAEMLCDWMSSCKRHNDGNILQSLEINKKRFNMSDDLYNILLNTVKHFDAIKGGGK